MNPEPCARDHETTCVNNKNKGTEEIPTTMRNHFYNNFTLSIIPSSTKYGDLKAIP